MASGTPNLGINEVPGIFLWFSSLRKFHFPSCHLPYETTDFCFGSKQTVKSSSKTYFCESWSTSRTQTLLEQLFSAPSPPHIFVFQGSCSLAHRPFARNTSLPTTCGLSEQWEMKLKLYRQPHPSTTWKIFTYALQTQQWLSVRLLRTLPIPAAVFYDHDRFIYRGIKEQQAGLFCVCVSLVCL